MPHPDDFYDPSQHGPDLSRGFPGLRVWLTVKLYGAAAYRAAITEKRALALDAYRRLAALRGLVIDAPPELLLFPFHVTWPGGSRAEEDAATRQLVDRTTARGRVMASGAVARGRYQGRVCVLSFRTHAEQIDWLVEDVEAALREIRVEGSVQGSGCQVQDLWPRGSTWILSPSARARGTLRRGCPRVRDPARAAPQIALP
jgi:aromatic-L-amino-acid decarboxylase